MLFRTRKEAAFGQLFVLKCWDNAMPIRNGDVPLVGRRLKSCAAVILIEAHTPPSVHSGAALLAILLIFLHHLSCWHVVLYLLTLHSGVLAYEGPLTKL